MHYAQIKLYDIANGPGIRTSLFVSGCCFRCPDCQNQEAQDFNYGQLWTLQDEERWLTHIKTAPIDGVTILGGEPFAQLKDDSLLHLLRRIKQETTQPLWIYSGFTYEQLIQNPQQKALLAYCDVLVDGLFVSALKDYRLRFKGSSNQRFIDVPQSLAQHLIIERKEYDL